MAAKKINLDTLVSEPMIVTIGGVEYPVSDPPMKRFFKLQKNLQKYQENVGDSDAIEQVIIEFAEITGIPTEALDTLTFALYQELIRELVSFFARSSRKTDSATQQAPETAESSPNSPSPSGSSSSPVS